MTLAVSQTETQTHLLNLYYSLLLVIENVRLPFSHHKILNTKNMIYNMLEFHIPRFIDLNISRGFYKTFGNKFF